jgi:DNA-binding MurR/RpiR family transcriptional regulator
LHAKRSFQPIVREAYGDYSPAERRLADLILNFPGELPGYSASELAVMAEISNAAVSRFVRRLGFKNYEEMRRLAREEREAGAPLYLFNRGEAGSPTSVLDRHAEAARDNIMRSVAAVDRTAFAALVSAVIDSRLVWVVGFGHCHFLAGYLRWSLAHARAGVRLLPAAGETLGESIVDLGRGDVLIVVAMRRRVPIIDPLVSHAKTAGARIALLTDPGMIATVGADWVFRLTATTRGPIDDHSSILVVSHALTEEVMLQLGSEARTRLTAIDDIHADLNEL